MCRDIRRKIVASEHRRQVARLSKGRNHRLLRRKLVEDDANLRRMRRREKACNRALHIELTQQFVSDSAWKRATRNPFLRRIAPGEISIAAEKPFTGLLGRDDYKLCLGICDRRTIRPEISMRRAIGGR